MLREAAQQAGDALPSNACLNVMIHRWENDRSGISERYLLHYCRAFRIWPEQFGIDATLPPPEDEPAFDTATETDGRPEFLAAVLATNTGPGTGPAHAAGWRRSSAAASGRGGTGAARQPGLGSGLEAGERILQVSEQCGEHARAAERRDIGAVGLEQLSAATIRLSQESLSGDPVPVFLDLGQLGDRIQRALGQRVWPADQRELYFLLGCLSSLMATTACDAGSPAAAGELARAGLTYAVVIGHQPLMARLRCDLAVIAYWTGRARECLNQTAAGFELTPDGPTAAQLHLARARAAVRLGELDAARRALRDADQVPDSESAGGDLARIGGQFALPRARRHYLVGSVLTDIPGAEHEARNELGQAIKLYQQESGHDNRPACHWYMTARIDLAVAQLCTGDLDEAEAAARPVLALPPALRVFTLRSRLGEVIAALTAPPYHGSVQAQYFATQIRQYCLPAAHTDNQDIDPAW